MEYLEICQLQVLWVFTGGKEGIEPGSFYNYLIEATIKADNDNRSRIALGFPEVAGAVTCYQTGKDREKYPVITKYVEG